MYEQLEIDGRNFFENTLYGIPGERGGVAGGGWYEGEYDGVLERFVKEIVGGGTGGWL